MLCSVLALAIPATAERAPFVDAGARIGLDFHHFNGASGQLYMVETNGSGVGMADVDGDGDLDLYLVQGAMLEPGKTPADATVPAKHPLPLTDRLYRNDLTIGPDGRRTIALVDITTTSGLSVTDDYGFGVAAGDVDNDGDVDLYVANFGSNRLLRNRGNGTFEDITARAGADDSRWSVGASLTDYDRDGWLDIYVVNYVDFAIGRRRFCLSPKGLQDYCGPLAYAPVGDRLLRNRGDGTFEDVTARAGVDQAGTGLGIVASDFDGNGWLDFYIANDQMANYLYLNQGTGKDGVHFLDEAMLAGTAVNAEGVKESSMGVDAGDLDGDGSDDLFMTHLNGETNTVYLNDGTGLFRDGSLQTGLGTPSWGFTGFGTAFLDYDMDGWLDVVAVNGAVAFSQVESDTLAQPDQLFRNLGGGRFEETTARAGAAFQVATISRGVAIGDLDNDGDPDVLIADNNGPARLLLNQADPQPDAWVGLRLLAGDPARDQVGARVALERRDASPIWRRVRTDGSFASTNDPRVRFGLGSAPDKPATGVLVLWPDGTRERFTAPPAGRYSTLRQGTGQPDVPSKAVETHGDDPAKTSD